MLKGVNLPTDRSSLTNTPVWKKCNSIIRRFCLSRFLSFIEIARAMYRRTKPRTKVHILGPEIYALFDECG